MKIRWNFQSLFTSMVDAFPSCKDVQSAIGQDRKMDTIMEISIADCQPTFLYNKNYYEPQQQHSCALHWLGLSRIANTRQPVNSKLSHKHDIL